MENIFPDAATIETEQSMWQLLSHMDFCNGRKLDFSGCFLLITGTGVDILNEQAMGYLNNCFSYINFNDTRSIVHQIYEQEKLYVNI